MANVSLSSFLKDLAIKAGMNPDNPEAVITSILTNPEFQKFVIPEEIISDLNKSLVSVTDAKNNHTIIKSHYFGEFMANLNRGLDDIYRELEFDTETINELNSERVATKRVGLLGEKLKKFVDEKSAAAGKKPSEQVASLNQTITDLNEKLRVEKEARKVDNTTNAEKFTKLRTNLALNGKTSGIKTIYDELPSEVRTTTIETLLNKELQDSNATYVLEENGSLKLQMKDGSNYFDENNRQLSLDDFINKTLAKHKVLKQSAPNSEHTGGNPAATNGQPPIVGGGQKSRINVDALMAESLQGLEAEPTKMI